MQVIYKKIHKCRNQPTFNAAQSSWFFNSRLGSHEQKKNKHFIQQIWTKYQKLFREN